MILFTDYQTIDVPDMIPDEVKKIDKKNKEKKR